MVELSRELENHDFWSADITPVHPGERYRVLLDMPVTEFGGIWGYNPRQLLAVHTPWGSAEQLKQLIERAHRLGIAVIMDTVINHGSAKLNRLWNWDGYGPDGCGGIYFEGEKDTPWGRRFAFHKWEVKAYGGWAGSGFQQRQSSDQAEQLRISVPKWSALAFKLDT